MTCLDQMLPSSMRLFSRSHSCWTGFVLRTLSRCTDHRRKKRNVRRSQEQERDEHDLLEEAMRQVAEELEEQCRCMTQLWKEHPGTCPDEHPFQAQHPLKLLQRPSPDPSHSGKHVGQNQTFTELCKRRLRSTLMEEARMHAMCGKTSCSVHWK